MKLLRTRSLFKTAPDDQSWGRQKRGIGTHLAFKNISELDSMFYK